MQLEWRPAHDPVTRALAEAQQRELDLSNPPDHVGYALRDDIEFVVALDGGTAIGCGALQPLGPTAAEVKRMYVVPAARGTGLSRRILAALEQRAVERGCTHIRLETALMFTAAVGLYRSSGYTEIPAYGEYVGDRLSYCMEKRLSGSPA